MAEIGSILAHLKSRSVDKPKASKSKESKPAPKSTVTDEATGKEKPATPIKKELRPKPKELITFLTPEQKHRQDELSGKDSRTIKEQNELNSLNNVDPFQHHDKLMERVRKGEVLKPKELAFVDKFEATEEYKKFEADKVKKAKEDEAKKIEDATREKATPEGARALLEEIKAKGITSKGLETQAQVYLEVDTPHSQAMGLDLMKDALVKRQSELNEQWESARKPAERERLKAQFESTAQELAEIKIQRDKITAKEPKYSENQWNEFATAITGSNNVGENPTLKVEEHISNLSKLNKSGREQEFKRWKEAGIMDEKTIEAFEKLISDEHSKERNERIGSKAKKIGLVAALLMGLSVWAAAKKAGADGQMGGH